MDRKKFNPKEKVYLNGFEDILTLCRNSWDLIFMAKRWDPTKAFYDGSKIWIKQLKRMVMESERVAEAAEEIESETGVSKEILYKNVEAHLDELGHNRKMHMIRFLGYFLCKLLKNNYIAFYVNDSSVKKVKELMGSNPVLFIPSHRSYADFILMSFICYYYDIEIPNIAAGMDFKEIKVLGNMLRDCCAFYMKRSFGHDKLYKAVIREYVNLLVKKSDSPLEFFIEGTRSRSGKALTPKLGFLLMVLESYFLGKVPDITIVPISLTYDKFLEEKLFAREMLGIVKPSESLWGFFRGLKVMDQCYGKIYVQFGEPISLKQYCSSKPDIRSDFTQVSEPGHPQYLTPRIANLSQDLGHLIVHEQQSLMVITPFNLIATVIFQWICIEGRIIFLGNLIWDCLNLSSTLRRLGGNVDFPDSFPEASVCVKSALHIHSNIVRINLPQANLVLVRTPESFRHVRDQDLKGFRLCDTAVTNLFPLFLLHQYINPCYHLVIHVAILTAILNTSDKCTTSKDELFENYCLIRQMLRQEFAFHFKWEEQDFSTALKDGMELGIMNACEDEYSIRYNPLQPINHLLLGLLHPFFIAYFTTISVCQQKFTKNEIIYEQELPKIVQFQVQSTYSSSDMSYGYALSLGVIKNTIENLVEFGVLVKAEHERDRFYNFEPAQKVHLESLLSKLLHASESALRDKNDMHMWTLNNSYKSKL